MSSHFFSVALVYVICSAPITSGRGIIQFIRWNNGRPPIRKIRMEWNEMKTMYGWNAWNDMNEGMHEISTT